MADTIVISPSSTNDVTIGPVSVNQISVSSPEVRTVSAIILQGEKGDTGSTGATGATGAAGDDGADGGSSIVAVTSAPTTAANFTVSGSTYDLLFDKSTTSSSGYIYGLNSASTGIYRWSGSRTVILILNIESFALQNSSGSTISTGTTYEIGATSNKWQEDCHGFNANYSNVAGGTLSGTNQIAITNRSSSQSWGSSALTIETSDLSSSAPNQVLTDFRDGASAADFDVYYPDDSSWSSGIKTLVFSLTANDGSTSDTASLTFNFKNRIFYGTSALSSLTSAQIVGLANEPFAGTNFLLSETSISTSGAQYIYYCYPSRLSGTPVFKLGGFNTDFNSLTDVSVTNDSGYVEDYKVYRSNLQFTDASSTLQVTT